MTDAYIGRVLSNRYQLVELIGKGAMGRVYRAEDRLLGGVPVAVKFLSQTLLTTKMKERFEREATTCAILGQKSMHIVRVMDYGVDQQEVPFYVMEYLEGESLSDVISNQPLPLPKFLMLARHICLGLQCAHQGIPILGKVYPIIHRDIKPSNILICKDATLGDLAKILDFGIAKLLQSNSEATGSFMGTLAYASPEQMEGKELDNRSDIYSLGVLLFEMLTREMPIHPETHSFGSWYKAHHFTPPRAFASTGTTKPIPKVLEGLIMQCLAKSPSDRPQNVGEIIKILEAVERDQAASQVEKSAPPSQSPSQQTIAAAAAQTVLASQPAKPVAPPAPLAEKFIADAIQTVTWPQDKPIAEIVFPQVLKTTQGGVPALLIMMPEKEVTKRLNCSRYNQFLFLLSPHPMVLWITVLYNYEYGPRWLPCYLDLKTKRGQELARLLGDKGEYQLLFFAQEHPQKCTNTLAVSISEFQCRLLQEWANTSQTAKSVEQPSLSRNLLKSEYEKLKPKILMKLDSSYVNGVSRSNFDIAG
jgi:serine/threonine-protein kinase